MLEAALASFIYLDVCLHLKRHLTNWKNDVTCSPFMSPGSFCVSSIVFYDNNSRNIQSGKRTGFCPHGHL